MKLQSLVAGVSLFSLLSAQVAAQPTENLQAMLQGESADSIRQLVEAAGGSVTHDLPLINAVGAELTRAQLEQIQDAPEIDRVIDDLANEPPPELPEEEEACDVAGALEVHWDGAALSWQFFNTGDAARALTRLSYAGNAGPTEPVAIRLAGKPLSFTREAAGSFSIEPEDASIAPGAQAELQLRFADRIEPPPAQSSLELSASFGPECEIELIPGYPANLVDTYYPTVTGAATLHSLGIRGQGITVAVLDSGLWEHDALSVDSAGENKIIARYDAIQAVELDEVFDESGHGTHMTSIIADARPVTSDTAPQPSFRGIAPDARIVAVKAFDREGQGDFLNIVRGIQWVVDNKERFDIRILNLSFAARPRWPYWLDPVNQAVMRAWAAGIVVVAAAGNEGPAPMTVGSPGNLPYIITVGAFTDSWTVGTRDDDYVPDFSSQGPTPSAHIKPDLVAPGGHMAGLTRPGSTLHQEFPNYMLSTGEFVMTGTSQAAAAVSGLAALLLQLEPSLSPDDVKCRFLSSAEPAINRDGTLAYSPFQQGRGMISLPRAITLGESGCGNPGMDVSADIAADRHFSGPAIIRSEDDVSLPGLDRMYKGLASEKGLSESRRWGAREHVERDWEALGVTLDEARDPNSPFDWVGQYIEEGEKIRRAAESDSP